MEPKAFEQLSDQELLATAKKAKATKLYDAVIMGVLIGIAIYSSVKNGFGLLTFLPLVYIPIAKKNQVKRNKVALILEDRKLS